MWKKWEKKSLRRKDNWWTRSKSHKMTIYDTFDFFMLTGNQDDGRMVPKTEKCKGSVC